MIVKNKFMFDSKPHKVSYFGLLFNEPMLPLFLIHPERKFLDPKGLYTITNQTEIRNLSGCRNFGILSVLNSIRPSSSSVERLLPMPAYVEDRHI